MRYPRNMQGYGGHPPLRRLARRAKVAVQPRPQLRGGRRELVLHGDAASEGFLSEIPGAQPWPGQRHWNMESVYEYGARPGFWRLQPAHLGDVPVTVYGVATALARSPAQLAAMQEAGWEIASHGLKLDRLPQPHPRSGAAGLDEAIRLHTEVTGEPPRVVHRPHLDSDRDLASETGAFDWIADAYDDDLPYWRGTQPPELIIPYTLETNDMRFSAGTFTTSHDFFTYLRDTFDTLCAEGEAGARR